MKRFLRWLVLFSYPAPPLPADHSLAEGVKWTRKVWPSKDVFEYNELTNPLQPSAYFPTIIFHLPALLNLTPHILSQQPSFIFLSTLESEHFNIYYLGYQILLWLWIMAGLYDCLGGLFAVISQNVPDKSSLIDPKTSKIISISGT